MGKMMETSEAVDLLEIAVDSPAIFTLCFNE